MRPGLKLLSCLFLPLIACSGSASDPDTLDEGPMSRVVAPPALAPVETDVVPSQAEAPKGADGLAPAYRNTCEGSVAGYFLNATHSFFLQGIMRIGDEQPTLVFVQSNAPNLCEHMAAGTMPQNVTIFAAALVQTDGKPVQENFSYTAPGHHGMDEDPRSVAFFRQLNQACEVFPDDIGAQATYGQAIIRKLVPNTTVVVDYAFDFEEAGSLKGHVEAPYCEAPGFFANPEQFYQPIEAHKCLPQ